MKGINTITIILILINCLALPSKGNAFEVSIHESFNATPLKEVFVILKTKYNIQLAYGDKMIENINITAELTGENLKEALAIILHNSGMGFEILSANIVIIKKVAPTAVNEPLKLSLTGVVTDGSNNERLPYAYIFQGRTKKQTTANVEGFFSIASVHLGDSLFVSYLGYQDTVLVLSKKHLNERIIIPLRPTTATLEEVVIKDQIPLHYQLETSIGKVTMNPLVSKTIPTNGEPDVFRSIQLLPGITATKEMSSGLSILGGVNSQNLVEFDGFTVYHLDHFFGYYSAFNPNAIKAIKVYTGGFEAKYGGRVSGVIDITGKDGNPEKVGGSLELNLMSLNTTLEIPISDGGTTLFLSARRSYTDVVATSLFDNIFSIFESDINDSPESNNNGIKTIQSDLTPEFYYSDLNIKLSSPVGIKNRMSFSFYNSSDILNFNAISEYDIGDTLNLLNDQIGYLNWGNIGTSLKFNRNWNEQHFTHAQVSYTQFVSEMYELGDNRATNDNGTVENWINSTDQSNFIKDLTFKLGHTWNFHTNHIAELGLALGQYQTAFKSAFNDNELANEKVNAASLFSVYAQDEMSFNNRLFINVGFRSSYYGINKQLYLEPRLSATFQATEKIKLKAATGKYQQFINQSNAQNVVQGSRDFWLMANDKNIPIQTSTHVMAALHHAFKGGFIELGYFNKSFDGVLEYAYRRNNQSSEFNNIQRAFDTGTSQAEGTTVQLKKDIGLLSLNANYTYSTVVNQFKELNQGEAYYADHDQRHELNFLATYSHNNFELSATWLFGSGTPYSIFENGPPSQNNTVHDKIQQLVPIEKNALRLAPYHRLDIAGTYNFRMGNTQAQFKLSLFNVYNKKNVYDVSTQVVLNKNSNSFPRRNLLFKTETSYLLGFTPNVSFGIKF